MKVDLFGLGLISPLVTQKPELFHTEFILFLRLLMHIHPLSLLNMCCFTKLGYLLTPMGLYKYSSDWCITYA